MDQNNEAALDDNPTPSGERSKPDVELSDAAGNLAGAIDLLEPGKPLVLTDGFLATDSGHLILSQYVDIGVEKLRHRPAFLVKYIEARYAIEHAPDIQLSAPSRFREYGETFIRDDQEGRAQRKTKTENPARSHEDQDRELEKALRLLGQEGVTIRSTGTTSSHTDTDSMTFGRHSWIYCMSMAETHDERSAQRANLPDRYDHESVIRQPGKFVLALGAMLTDQRGPQGKRGHLTHAGGLQSFHNTQLVLHGPVWYTDDVLAFLRSRESEPLYNMYPVFVKHSKYRDQREYRIVLHCDTPVEDKTLHLYISGAMRDALAPPRTADPVAFQRVGKSDADSSSQKVVGPTPTHQTMTQTRKTSRRGHRTIRVGGKVAQEEIITSEQTIVLRTELPVDGQEHAECGPEAPVSGVGEITETESRERRIAGATTDKTTEWHTRAFSIADISGADKLFTPEDRDHAEELLEAVGRPFVAFSTLPQEAIEVLRTLADQASHLEPEVEVQTMSACWNGIWAICNLYECFGDVVASVGIEHNEFVAITLKNSAHTGAEGKILVGPRGTFAYMLTRGDEQRPGHGGAENRLFFFPDEEARAAFEEFGWIPLEDQDPA